MLLFAEGTSARERRTLATERRMIAGRRDRAGQQRAHERAGVKWSAPWLGPTTGFVRLRPQASAAPGSCVVAHREGRLSRGRGNRHWCGGVVAGVMGLRFARRSGRLAGFATFGHAHIRGAGPRPLFVARPLSTSSAPTRGWVLRRARAGKARTASPTAQRVVSVRQSLGASDHRAAGVS
jgi:hypothetical protein